MEWRSGLEHVVLLQVTELLQGLCPLVLLFDDSVLENANFAYHKQSKILDDVLRECIVAHFHGLLWDNYIDCGHRNHPLVV